tara:strand:- start:320 stop:574 length:255 start_codon:yes stop_codon:yes gene_type:complete
MTSYDTTNYHALAAKASLTTVYPITWNSKYQKFACDADTDNVLCASLDSVIAWHDDYVAECERLHAEWHEEVEANRDPSQPRYN